MTCIVALAQNGRVYIGGDSAGVGGLDLTVRADEKVFQKGEFVMGFTTSFRMGQLLRFKFTPPEQPQKMADYEYMVTRFVDQVRETLKGGGFATTKDGAEAGGTFLAGYRGRIYKIYSDYQVAMAVDPYDACGCGESMALGSLFTSHKNPKLKPDDRVMTALHCAERFSAGVRGPFLILSTEAEKGSAR